MSPQTRPLLLRTAAGTVPKRVNTQGKGEHLTGQLEPSRAGEMKRIRRGDYVTFPHVSWRLSLGSGPSRGFPLLIQMGSGFPSPGCSLGTTISPFLSIILGPGKTSTEFRPCVRPQAELDVVGAVAGVEDKTCALTGE